MRVDEPAGTPVVASYGWASEDVLDPLPTSADARSAPPPSSGRAARSKVTPPRPVRSRRSSRRHRHHRFARGALESGRVRSELVHVLGELVEDAAALLGCARRVTGFRVRRRGEAKASAAAPAAEYDAELAREIRARRTGRPLSLVLLSPDGGRLGEDRPAVDILATALLTD